MNAPPQDDAPLKRFYASAGTAPSGALHTVTLDGRPVRTPGRTPLAVPKPVAERIAGEWAVQEEFIRPLSMPLTRLANSAIDSVAAAVPAVQDDIVAFAANDLVLYRAETPEGLVAAQRQRWDPLVRFGETRTGVRLVLAEGVMPVTQDVRFGNALRTLLPDDPLRLAALHQLTTLTGSAITALALAEREISFAEGWAAAHVDEDWNIAEWGEDAEAMSRRATREADAEAAHFVLAVASVATAAG